MTVEEKLKYYINARYESVNDFCIRSGIPNSTLQTIFTRGVANTSSKTMFKLCDALNLDAQALYAGRLKEKKRKPKTPDAPVDLFDYITALEETAVAYKGTGLTKEQKERLVFGFRVVIGMVMGD